MGAELSGEIDIEKNSQGKKKSRIKEKLEIDISHNYGTLGASTGGLKSNYNTFKAKPIDR